MGLLCCACQLFSLSTGGVVARREPALDRPPPRLAVILPVKGSADRRGGPPRDRILLLDLHPDLPRRGHQAAAGGRRDRGLLLRGGVRRGPGGWARFLLIAAAGDEEYREQEDRERADRHERAENLQERCHRRERITEAGTQAHLPGSSTSWGRS